MAEPYSGEMMYECRAIPFDFWNAYAVVVTGARWNPCGHMLINTGGKGPMGYYFHVAEARGLPRYMRGDALFQRYLKEEGKKEVSRTRVMLKNPDAANQKLEELLAEKWTWFILLHNCASFVETVLQAGGTTSRAVLELPDCGGVPMKVLRRVSLGTVGAIAAAIAAWAFVIFFLPSTPIERAMLIMLISCVLGFCAGLMLRPKGRASVPGR